MGVFNGDILRVSCNFELGDGTQYQNIYHYVRDGTDPVSDSAHVANLAIKLNLAYDTLDEQVKSDVTNKLSFVDRVEFNEITDQWEVVENIGVFTLEFTPTGATDSLPFQSSPYVIFKTQRPKSVGKKFLFPFLETTQAGTILIESAMGAVVAYSAAVLSSVELGGDATLTAGIVRTGIQSFLNFLVAVVGDLLGSQKRRRPGVGA